MEQCVTHTACADVKDSTGAPLVAEETPEETEFSWLFSWVEGPDLDIRVEETKERTRAVGEAQEHKSKAIIGASNKALAIEMFVSLTI